MTDDQEFVENVWILTGVNKRYKTENVELGGLCFIKPYH